MTTTLIQHVEYLDKRGQHVNFQPTGELYVQQPYNTLSDWMLIPAKEGDVGMDFPVRISGMENFDTILKPRIFHTGEKDHPEYIDYENGILTIPAGGYASLPSGIHVKIPDDAWGAIRPRSSTGWKKHIQVFEGTIDNGYTGQIACLVFNPHTTNIKVYDGDSLAQLVIIPKYDLKKVVVTDILPDTKRGDTGFGSSGK
jgi:dUTP pyrophosphatase